MDEVFGYYYNTEIQEKYHQRQKTDDKTFQFNLQSKDNRLLKPMKFEIKHIQFGSIVLYSKEIKPSMIMLGNLLLGKDNGRKPICCLQKDYRILVLVILSDQKELL